MFYLINDTKTFDHSLVQTSVGGTVGSRGKEKFEWERPESISANSEWENDNKNVVFVDLT